MCVALSQRGPAPQGRAHLMVAGDHIATAGVKGALRQPPAALDPHIRAGKPTETRGVPKIVSICPNNMWPPPSTRLSRAVGQTLAITRA